MRHWNVLAIGAVCLAAGGLGVADELDDLVRQVRPKARFAEYTPRFRVERRTFTFHHVTGPKQEAWAVIRDGEKYVAIWRSAFHLLALTPDAAKTTLNMPTGRYHLDNYLGPMLYTGQFLKPVRMHGSIVLTDVTGPKDEWTGGGETITLTRSLQTEGRVARHRFVLSVDPVLGYRIDGHYDVRFEARPEKATFVGPTFTPGCYPPWPKDRVYDRTVHCPAGGGYRGWANNLVCMDRCDSRKSDCTWRDGGFIAFLTRRDGWGSCRTRADGGGAVAMPVCNAHNDFHVRINLPANLPTDETGRRRFQAHHRLCGLPPELSAHVWDRMELIQKNARGVFVSIGEPEGFEDQPMALTEPERGITWTSHPPEIVTDVARTGSRSALLTKSTWPNLPQVSCLPDSKFLLEAYFKVVPWTRQQVAAARAKDDARRAGLKKKGKPLPPPVEWDRIAPEAYLTAHVYEWTPHSRTWLVRQQTTKATGDKPGWQRAVLQFDTPKWDPCVNIVFEVRGCTAYLDDFRLVRIDPAGAPPNLSVHPAAEVELAELGCTRWPTRTHEAKRFRRTPGRTETLYVTAGEAVVDTPAGTVTLQAGHLVVLPEGLQTEWDVRQPLTMHYRAAAPAGTAAGAARQARTKAP